MQCFKNKKLNHELGTELDKNVKLIISNVRAFLMSEEHDLWANIVFNLTYINNTCSHNRTTV